MNSTAPPGLPEIPRQLEPATGRKAARRAVGPFPVPLFLLTAFILATPSCTRQPEPYRHTQFLMGTIVEAVVYPDRAGNRDAVGDAFRTMAGIEELAHPGRGEAPLKRLAEGEEVKFEGPLLKILTTAREVQVVSGGAFDPGLGELVEMWGIGGPDPAVPGEEEIAGALARRKRLEEEARSGGERSGKPCCPPPGSRLDLGGVAKGYAVDRAVDLLKAGGVAAGIVNAGGDLRSWGRRPGRGTWRVGIQDPDDPQGLLGVLEVSEAAVATSGDYQRYFEAGGRRYHHILDPATGYPADSGVRSTTVVADNCALADALATAAFVLGPEEGLLLLEGWQGVEGVIVDAAGNLRVTSGIGKTVPFERR